jgi:hypothetical protein
MPLRGRATARNCSALLGCPRSHMGSCSLEGPPWSRDRLPLEADFPIFSAGVQAERRSPLATCSVFISVGWCTNVAAPNTYRGSPAMTMASAESHDAVFCALETYQYPHTVLCKGMATRHVRVPVRLRFGGGAAHINRMRPAPHIQELEWVSNQRLRVRAHAPMCSYAFNDASRAEHLWRLGP